MCVASTVNIISCEDTTLVSHRELLAVKDSYERVALTATSSSLIRTIVNIANGIETNASELSNDRDLLYRERLNTTIEKLRHTQKRLKIADFKFSEDFKQYLLSELTLENLCLDGSPFQTNRTHHMAMNLYAAKIQELLHIPREHLNGRIEEMTLKPTQLDDDNQPTDGEMLSYFLIQNGIDSLREWNLKFQQQFVQEAGEHTDQYLSVSRAMTITSCTLIIAVFIGMAWLLAKLQEKKVQALSFFLFVSREQCI